MINDDYSLIKILDKLCNKKIKLVKPIAICIITSLILLSIIVIIPEIYMDKQFLYYGLALMMISLTICSLIVYKINRQIKKILPQVIQLEYTIKEQELKMKEQELLIAEQKLNTLEQDMINYIKQDITWETCTTQDLRRIYLYNLLFDPKGNRKQPYGELANLYFCITQQRTLRLTDKGVWLLHYLENHELIDGGNTDDGYQSN